MGRDLWAPKALAPLFRPRITGLPRLTMQGPPKPRSPAPQSACPRRVLLPPLSREPREESGPGEACRRPGSNRVGFPSPSHGPHARLRTQAWRGLGPSAGAGPAGARGARRAQALARPTLSEVAEATRPHLNTGGKARGSAPGRAARR